MKALITFIGNHDPFSDSRGTPGPILSILEKRKYDKLYLLFNNDKYWKKVFATQEYCNKHYPQMKVEMRLTEAINPINYNLVYPAMYNVVSRIVKENAKAKFTISITSGTPTMHSCWILLVQGGVINAEILQVSRENGIEKVTFELDDFPNIAETPETKVELTRLTRENAELKKYLDLDYSLKNGFYIPNTGLNID
ncbi:MAG: RNA repair transcriptional activator RtcR family protein, partial [Candidatus Zophobacter franzmannii]|nr:RNA repair transcriptional activator RtcR family protein [Candidatus Zophobacter franzmannii]